MTENHNREIRLLTVADYDTVLSQALELAGDKICFRKSAYENRLIFFPDGQLGLFSNNVPVVSASSILIDSDFYKHSYKFLKGPESGYIADFNPDGDTLFLFNVIRDEKKYDPESLELFFKSCKNYCKRNNLKKIIVSLQSYFFPPLFGIENINEYITEVQAGNTEDNILNPLFNSGLKFRKKVDYKSEKKNYSDMVFEWGNYDFKADIYYNRKKKTARICTVQQILKPAEDFNEYAGRVKYFVDTAASYKSDFVIFPELNTLSLFPEVIEKEDINRFISGFTGRYINLFRELAVEAKINIISGSTITCEEDKYYNSFFSFDKTGDVQSYKKIHLTRFDKEFLNLSAGNIPGYFAGSFCKTGIASGYDVQFPEIVREIADFGADILFVPYIAENEKEFKKIKITAESRTVENQIFVVMTGISGSCEAVKGKKFYSRATVITPPDYVFPSEKFQSVITENTEDVIITDLNLELLARNRRVGDSSNVADRRNDLYKIIRTNY